MKRIILLAIFAILSIVGVEAQVQAPDLVCVSNDTLIWNLPTNDCGDFISYDIYVSSSVDGPYSLLTAITDPTATQYFNMGAGTQTLYYYMQSTYDCPGIPVWQSDTLDNRIPEAPIVNYVTQDNGTSEISWQESPSPEAFAYVITRESALGVITVDTVYTGTIYFDSSASPDTQSETYYVTTIDACGNASLFSDAHNTLFVSTDEGNVCDQNISMNWNPYINWANGVEKYEIWVSENGGAFLKVDEVDGNTHSYIYDDVSENINYCYYIQAIENTTAYTSVSNTQCKTLEISNPIGDLLMTSVDIINTNEAIASWQWDDNSAVLDATLYVSTSPAMTNPYTDDFTVSYPLDMINNITHDNPNMNYQQLFYQVVATDSCSNNYSSNIIGTVYLEESTNNLGNNTLNWTPYTHDQASNITYDIYRVENDVPTLIQGGLQNQYSHNDVIDLNNVSERSVCYYIIANADIELADGSIVNLPSRSNVVCITQEAKMFLPNVFAPEGINSSFKPIFPYGYPVEYSLDIYDRWGGLVFSTKNPAEGWNGKNGGSASASGTYVYIIEATQADGQILNKKGTVNILR